MISIVLVEPEHPGNIGAAARAMKNMGLKDLRLIGPPQGWYERATVMAVFAADLLRKARVFSSVEEAVGDAHLVVGTTRRHGAHRGALISLDAALNKVACLGTGKRAAFVFGKESKGLSNKSLSVCDWVMTLPAHEDYPSINLAQAVMLVAFSLRTHRRALPEDRPMEMVRKAEVLYVLKRIRLAVDHLGYSPLIGDRIQATFHGLLKRNGLTPSEAEMLKGISRRIMERTAR